MFNHHSFRKGIALITVFLICGLGTISTFATSSAFQSSETVYDLVNTNTESLPNEIPIIKYDNRLYPRILSYETMELRDQALNQINPKLVSYVFQNMPLISTYDIASNQIPTFGLTNQVEDLRIISTASSYDQLPLLSQEVSSGTTLAQSSQVVGVSALHQMGLTGEGIKIAIVDSGVNGSLAAFDNGQGSRVENYYIQPEYEGATMSAHGTHVAGIVGGNGFYLVDGQLTKYDSVGMAPDSDIISIQVLDQNGFGPISDVVAGIDLAISLNVDIISMSLSSEFYNGTDGSTLNDIQEIAVNAAVNNGIVVVAAAGNLGPFGSGIGIPGGLSSSIAVGAVELFQDGSVTMWSNSAVGPRTNGYPGPDVVAPGSSIVSVGMEENQISTLSGTSMATPHVSGGIALLKQAFPNATVNQIREAVTGSAKYLNSPIELQGRGLVDFSIAYEILERTTTNETTDTAFEMSISPRKIQDNNFVFRHQVIGTTKSQNFFIHSSKNVTIIPIVELSYGYNFSMSSEFDLVEGLNEITINSTIVSTLVERLSAHIYFTEKESGLPVLNANVTYSTFSRIHKSNILFDASKDFDTPVGYFGGHSFIGQFSIFGSFLESEGHQISTNFNDNITNDLLENYDVLIISDPDASYSQSEIDAIRNFVYVDGKALLIIANGGVLSAENQIYESFDQGSLEAILDGSGLGFERNDAGTPSASINNCPYDGSDVFSRINSCFTYAQTATHQSVLPELLDFPHYGPALEIETGTLNEIEEIAFLNNKPVILGSDLITSNGRILLFSSSLSFDNKAMRYGYGFDNSDETTNNRVIIRDSVDWLISPRSIHVNYFADGKAISEETEINLHKQIKFSIEVTDPEGNDFLTSESSIILQIIQPVYDENNRITGYLFNTIDAIKEGSVFTFVKTFNRYGTYDLYFSVIDPDGELISSDGHLAITANLALFEDQDEIYTLAFYMFFALVISWVLFLLNEGGRKKPSNKNESLFKT